MIKHLNKITKEDEYIKRHQNKEDDEDSYITETGPKIDIQDPLDVKERSVFFSNNEQPKTKTEIVQEKSRALRDQIDNTSQYQKFVNVALQQKTNDLKRMLEQGKRFSEEVNCFQDTTKTRQELEQVNSKYITESDTKSLINNLEAEYEKMREMFNYELSRVEKTRNDLQAKKQQIEQLKEELKFIVKNGKKEEKIDDPVLIIRQELKKLGISDDSGKITDALRLLSNKMNKNP